VYVILLKTYCVDELVFTMQRELSKLHINPVIFYLFSCKIKNGSYERFNNVFFFGAKKLFKFAYFLIGANRLGWVAVFYP
jgi:hypothetical protein